MSETAAEDAASTRAASARPCPRISSGGPQPAFCDLEEHNALTAHQERQRLAKESASGAPEDER